jgi:hypothetical protein
LSDWAKHPADKQRHTNGARWQKQFGAKEIHQIEDCYTEQGQISPRTE